MKIFSKYLNAVIISVVITLSANSIFAGTISYQYDQHNRLIKVDFSSTIAGDIDHNSSVDLEDAIMIIQIVSGMKSVQSKEISKCIFPDSDVDGNGNIAIEKAVYVIKKIAELGNE